METASDPYLSSQLIAYIGNKRRLLDSLARLFTRLDARASIGRMLDPFAGSGAVSRLGKRMGFSVEANDWEEYSRVINSTYLGVNAADIPGLFGGYGGLAALLERLNRLDGEPDEPYFSRYYAPASTEAADYRTERLFYTRENGLFLDRVRGWIEREYPRGNAIDKAQATERDILISMLLYEAATHANTSGVFKAFHKGFGGHGKDALKRIMAPMELEFPVLIDGPRGRVGAEDAVRWVAGRPAELCYLDPPYTIHQYGSNYHLLNSVARWDRPEASLERDAAGRLRRKAGIRDDWTSTRSDFCRRGAAAKALKELLQAVDARFIVLSYNSDGLIPFEELADIAAGCGRLELFSEAYTQYRGGRQGLTRRNLTTEFQLVLTRGAEHRVCDMEAVRRGLIVREIATLLESGYHPGRLAARDCFRAPASLSGGASPGAIRITGSPLQFEIGPDWRIADPAAGAAAVADLETPQLAYLRDALRESVFRDNGEEAEELLELLKGDLPDRARRRVVRRFLLLLRKLAHRKYRTVFEALHSRAASELAPRPWFSARDAERLRELTRLARRRFTG